MKIPMRFKYYDNWAKIPLIISGLIAGSGLGSWAINYIYLEDARVYYQDKLNEYLLMGIPALCCYILFKYLNYRIELKENTGIWSIEDNDNSINARLNVIFSMTCDPDTRTIILSKIQSTENRLVRLAIVDQLESSISEEIRKLKVFNTAQKLADKLSQEKYESLLSDLSVCNYAYEMEKVIKNYMKEQEIKYDT